MSGFHDRPLAPDERESLRDAFARDGAVIVPRRASPELIARAVAAIDRIAAAGEASDRSFRADDLLPRDPAFRDLASIPAVLQLVLDLVGPTLHLAQSTLFRRPAVAAAADDYRDASPWHADGPTPNHYPVVDGVPALLVVKVGIFLGDVPDEDAGALRVVPGSHRRAPGTWDLSVPTPLMRVAGPPRTLAVPAGGIIAFHNAVWHGASSNRRSEPRRNVYLTYAPLWHRAVDRDQPRAPDGWDAVARVLHAGATRPERAFFPTADELDPFAPWRAAPVPAHGAR
ncbi:MAG TPA: phytanoyl-CoA dioxygenase family protein [Planctomycetota bacterium]|nr:phytanoyl-CoA dioxygenase family protein [Planctomycetota bacterium]